MFKILFEDNRKNEEIFSKTDKNLLEHKFILLVLLKLNQMKIVLSKADFGKYIISKENLSFVSNHMIHTKVFPLKNWVKDTRFYFFYLKCLEMAILKEIWGFVVF